MAIRTLLYTLLAAAGVVHGAGVTVYGPAGQQPVGTATGTASTATASSASSTLEAYDSRVLDPPPLPDPLPANQFGIQLAASASNVQGLSIPQSGAFYGFSIEMSVATQVSEYHFDAVHLRLVLGGGSSLFVC